MTGMKYWIILSIVVAALISGNNALRINNAQVTNIFKATRPRLIENFVIGSLLAWTSFDISHQRAGDPSYSLGASSYVSAAETSLFAGM